MAPRLFQDPYHEGAAALQVLATVVVPVQRHRNEPRSGGQLGELAPGYQGEPHGQDVLSAEVVRGVEEFVELDPIYHAGTFTERLEARDDEETAIGSGEGAVQPERAVGRPDSDGRVVERADQAPPFFETTVCGPQRELLVAFETNSENEWKVISARSNSPSRKWSCRTSARNTCALSLRARSLSFRRASIPSEASTQVRSTPASSSGMETRPVPHISSRTLPRTLPASST